MTVKSEHSSSRQGPLSLLFLEPVKEMKGEGLSPEEIDQFHTFYA